MCCPSNEVIKSDSRIFLAIAIGGLHGDRMCDALPAMAPTNVRAVHQISLPHVESILDRLGLLSPTVPYPTASVLSNKADRSCSNEF